MVPALLGGLVLLNAAIAQGPLAALPEGAPADCTGSIDLVLAGGDRGRGRAAVERDRRPGPVILVGVAAVLGFVTWKTDYPTK